MEGQKATKTTKPSPKKTSSKKNTPKKVTKFVPKTTDKNDKNDKNDKTDKNAPKTTGKKDTIKSVVFVPLGGEKNMRNEFGKRIKRRTYFLKHRPIREDAFLWLARTYTELERFDEAESP